MLYILILIFGAVSSVIGPWWCLPLVAALCCAFKAKSANQAFLVSSAAGITLWTTYSLILIYSGKKNLVNEIATLFVGKSEFLSSIPSVGFILFVVTFIASLVTGFGGLAGKQIHSLVRSFR